MRYWEDTNSSFRADENLPRYWQHVRINLGGSRIDLSAPSAPVIYKLFLRGLIMQLPFRENGLHRT